MLLNKRTIARLTLSAVLLTPAFAQANLIINNNTTEHSTSILNNGPCSTIIGVEKGVTKANTTNDVPDSLLKKACIASRPRDPKTQPWVCMADVHMTADCSGTTIAHVVFDLEKGVLKVDMLNQDKHDYTIIVDPENKFLVSVNKASALQQWISKNISSFMKHEVK